MHTMQAAAVEATTVAAETADSAVPGLQAAAVEAGTVAVETAT